MKALSNDDFETDKFELKHESLKRANKEVLKLRTHLLVKFSKVFIDSSKTIKYTGNVAKGTLAYNFLRCKNLVFSSAKDKMLDARLKQRGGYGIPNMTINRNKAMMYANDGKVDHDGTESIFGQVW